MTCYRCGHALSPLTRYCGVCGLRCFGRIHAVLGAVRRATVVSLQVVLAVLLLVMFGPGLPGHRADGDGDGS